jgi:DNA modification methylase
LAALLVLVSGWANYRQRAVDESMSEIIQGDALTILRERFADESVQCCVTSPPYWGLRDYGCEGQLGLEATLELYVAKMVEVFREVKRVLRKDGTLWLNLGDSYGHGTSAERMDSKNGAVGGWQSEGNRIQRNGVKAKDLVGIPWRVAFALQADGWYLRSDIIWAKPNPMPESVTDRPTKAHEYLFLLAKSERYYYDADAIKEPGVAGVMEYKTPDGWDSSTGNGGHGSFHKNGREKGFKKSDEQRGHGRRHAGFNDRWDAMEKSDQCSGMRNKRTVWTIATQPYAEAHFATFPTKLIEPCILAGCPVGGLVLDPFCGSGTTMMVAQQLGRQGIGIELNADYIAMAQERCKQTVLPL